jgi:hypothetical protein
MQRLWWLLEGTLILTAGRLAVSLAVSGRRAIPRRLPVSERRARKRACLLPRPYRGAIAEELNDQENRKYERVKEQEVMSTPKEEQEVEPVAGESRSEDGIPYSPCLPLAASYTRDDQQCDATENEEQDIEMEHVGTPQSTQNNAARAAKVADGIANEVSCQYKGVLLVIRAGLERAGSAHPAR